MGVQLLVNNLATTLAAPCSAVATSITITDYSAAPSPSGGDWFLLTVYQLSSAQEINYEIMKVTARTLGVCTVVRAFEDGTRFPARSFTAGDFAECRDTAGTLRLASMTANVPAGNIAATDVQAALNELDTEKQAVSGKDASGGYAGLTAFKLNLRNAANTITSWFTTAATVARTWTLPDKDGTVAMTSDITVAAVGLSNVDNTSDVNKPVSTAQAAADTAATNAAKSYADGLVVGLWDDRGSFNASVNTFPTTGGSGTAGAILKGDIWTISVVATSGSLLGYPVGSTVRAIVDTPGSTVGNWDVLNVGLGYVAENSANKDATGGYAGLTLFKINFKNAANTFTSFFTNANTAARTYTFPDKDITVAGLDTNTFTAAQNITAVNKGSISNATVTFDWTAANVQYYTATGSTVTWAFSNVPASGTFGEMLIVATNQGNFTFAAGSTVNWELPTSPVTYTTTFSTYLAANLPRVALATAGVDYFYLWTEQGTVRGKLV